MVTNEICRALVDLEAGVAHAWRIRLSLAQAFPSFHLVFSSEQVYEHFVPMACRFLSGAVASIRPAAAEGLVCFLR